MTNPIHPDQPTQPMRETMTCPECEGAGETAGHYFAGDSGMAQCERCRGSGEVEATESNPTVTAETMPELVLGGIETARLARNPTPYQRLAIWLADDRERLLAALDKAQRERDVWKELHEKHCGMACCDYIALHHIPDRASTPTAESKA